jgi:2-oxo-3-hexenedioate decarboxylase
LEVIDSRFAGFAFDLGKVIADNTSAAAFVVGPWLAWDHRDLSNLTAELDVNGQPAQISSTAAILGQPLRALSELRTLAREHALLLRAGDTVLAGAVTEAVPLAEGVVEGRIVGLGRVMMHANYLTEGESR